MRALCDRHAGLGADGVIRLVARRRHGEFFMDYRNADGSVAEMCGNGARLFARYLVDAGLGAGRPDPVRHPRRRPDRARPGPAATCPIEMGQVTLGGPTRAALPVASSSTVSRSMSATRTWSA